MDDNRRPLVLALGNLLLEDDAVGLVMLDRLRHERPDLAAATDFVDGGTQGLALLGLMSGRPGIVVLDAVGAGADPGAVHVLDRDAALGINATAGSTAHEGGAAPLLAVAALLGDLPQWVRVIGVEPGRVHTGMGLSEPVRDSLQGALDAASAAIAELVEHTATAAIA